MIESVVTKLFRDQGFTVRIEDKALHAEKNGMVIDIGIVSGGELESFLRRVKDRGSIKIVIPEDELSEDEERLALSSSIMIWSVDEIEERISKELFQPLKLPKKILSEEVVEMKDKEPILAPVIGRGEVAEIGKKTVKGFKYVLQLVPSFVFEFESVIETPEIGIIQKKGMIGVNALTGNWQVWEKRPRTTTDVDLPHEKLEPAIEREEAKKIAFNAAKKLSTREVEIVRVERHAKITQKKVVSPELDQIEMKEMGILYLPLWCVDGVDGAIVINAATGKIVEEDYYRS